MIKILEFLSNKQFYCTLLIISNIIILYLTVFGNCYLCVKKHLKIQNVSAYKNIVIHVKEFVNKKL